jgi:O-antigen ligase
MNVEALPLKRLFDIQRLRTCGYYLLMLCLPLVFKPWGLIYLPTGNRLALPLLIVPLLVCLAVVPVLWKSKFALGSYFFPLLFVLGGYLIGVIATGPDPRGIELLLKLFLLLGLGISISLLTPSTRALRIGLVYLALVVAFMVSVELLHVFAGQTKLVNIMRGLRGQNATAYTLLILTPFPLLGAILSSSRLARLGLGLLGIVLIIGLFYTYSRGGIVSLPLGLFTAMLLTWKSKGARKCIMLSIIVVIGVYILLIATSPAPLRSELASSVEVSANLNRLVLLKAGLRVAEAHPILGIGLGGFDDVFLDYITKQEASLLALPTYSSSHNQYLHMWNEGGLIALIGFVWLLVRLLHGLRTALTDSTQSLLLACMAIWAGGIWFFFIETPANLEMFWVALGITLASLKLAN